MRFTKRTYRRARTVLTLTALDFKAEQDWEGYLYVLYVLRLIGNRARREKGMWNNAQSRRHARSTSRRLSKL